MKKEWIGLLRNIGWVRFRVNILVIICALGRFPERTSGGGGQMSVLLDVVMR